MKKCKGYYDYDIVEAERSLERVYLYISRLSKENLIMLSFIEMKGLEEEYIKFRKGSLKNELV